MRVGPMDWERNWNRTPLQLINNIIGQPTMRNARFTSRRGSDDATAVLVFQEAAHASWFIDAWNKLITSPTLDVVALDDSGSRPLTQFVTQFAFTFMSVRGKFEVNERDKIWKELWKKWADDTQLPFPDIALGD
ncbi:hypothetical protein B0H14DRAFT_3866131 [Mycena olivaceomarginata]|nr:hypothetical protein B0H14DRAFT_3866131 [Mycena olivaceomarginata]